MNINDLRELLAESEAFNRRLRSLVEDEELDSGFGGGTGPFIEWVDEYYRKLPTPTRTHYFDVLPTFRDVLQDYADTAKPSGPLPLLREAKAALLEAGYTIDINSRGHNKRRNLIYAMPHPRLDMSKLPD